MTEEVALLTLTLKNCIIATINQNLQTKRMILLGGVETHMRNGHT